MFFAVPAEPYEIDPIAAEAIDLLFILHADHEQNCSTSTVRMAGSSGANPYSAIAAGISALWGPAHGGANEAVLEMLTEIGDASQIPKYVRKGEGQGRSVPPDGLRSPRLQELRSARDDHSRDVPQGTRETRPPGLRRCSILPSSSSRSRSRTSTSSRRTCIPNVDFYSGIIYRALGIPTSMFTVMFAIGRSVGWCAHWREMISDPKGRDRTRPRQLYTGPAQRDYTPIEKR